MDCERCGLRFWGSLVFIDVSWSSSSTKPKNNRVVWVRVSVGGENGLHDSPDSDGVVRETGEEGLTVSGPSEGEAFWALEVVAGEGVGFELIDDGLGLEVKDLDTRRGGSTEPVSVGGEDEGVDDVSGLEGVEVLALVKVPKHGDTILTTGGGEGSIGGDGEGVDVTSVTVVVGLELALVELPNLVLRQEKETRKDRISIGSDVIVLFCTPSSKVEFQEK